MVDVSGLFSNQNKLKMTWSEEELLGLKIYLCNPPEPLRRLWSDRLD
jgi:hypothetical protein